VTGVDRAPQPHYCGDHFVHAEALRFLSVHGFEFDVIHASPPCQAESNLRFVNDTGWAHRSLLAMTAEVLYELGRPFVLENVVGARLRKPVVLCGEMFGLGVIRHRRFETNWGLTAPVHRPHRGRVRGWRYGVFYDGPYLAVYGRGGGKGSLAEWSAAMGIDWMTREGLAEAIPPAYTHYIGRQLREVGF
jgi:DNA (cytosine-5)-methyltransferase 1